VSPIRALIMNSMFHMPLAAVLGALVCFLVLEPHINDFPKVRGDVVLVNTSPFDLPGGVRTVTVGTQEVALTRDTRLLPGAQGQPAFGGVNEIVAGTAIEAVGIKHNENQILAEAVRPNDGPPLAVKGFRDSAAAFLLFPLTAVLVALGLILAEGVTSRNWRRMITRALVGSVLAAIFAFLAFIPAGLVLQISDAVFRSVAQQSQRFVVTVHEVPPVALVVMAACRSMAWAFIGAGLGLGMNLARSTRAQLRNSLLGGTLGGALGGLFFDPIDRFIVSSPFVGGGPSRLVGLLAVGLAIGLFVALVERLAREAWLKVLTGPLAGKSFVLYRTPTRLGSSPDADIYLYKDAEISADHALIHRAGSIYEVEDAGSRTGTKLAGQTVRRRRLVSGDQITLGGTVLVFEERAERRAPWLKQRTS